MQILSATKKHALTRGHVGCVGEVATLNLARGCAGACRFCYARCIAGVPTEGKTLLLYEDLPRQLRHELDNPRRKNPPPPYVHFPTYSDAFLGGEQVVRVTRDCLKILFNRGIGVSISTRGLIPTDVADLLATHAKHVRLTIPLPSLDDNYHQQWEPGTLKPRDRLSLIGRLCERGIKPHIRLDPIIPFINDHADQANALFSALKGLNISEAIASFLQLRPGLAQQMTRELPSTVSHLVLGCFSSLIQEPTALFHHLDISQTLTCLRRMQRQAREFEIRLSACHCQNPGLPAGRCTIAPELIPHPTLPQSDLFPTNS